MKRIILQLTLLISFFLGLHGDNIALWQTDRADPLEVYPYSISLYTKLDQQELKKGIPIFKTPDLTRYLDDYLS